MCRIVGVKNFKIVKPNTPDMQNLFPSLGI